MIRFFKYFYIVLCLSTLKHHGKCKSYVIETPEAAENEIFSASSEVSPAERDEITREVELDESTSQRSSITKNRPNPIIAVVKERISRGSDEITQKINQFLKFYKDESIAISKLENELNYIQDTLNSNSVAGEKLNLDQIKELTLEKISEKATALKMIKQKLADLIRAYSSLLNKINAAEIEIEKMKAGSIITNRNSQKRSELQYSNKEKTTEKVFVK